MTKSASDCAREIVQANAAITPQYVIDSIGAERWAAALESDIAAYAKVIQRYLDQSIKDTRAEYEALAKEWGVLAKRFDNDAEHIEESNSFKGKLHARADWLRNCAADVLALSPKPKV